MANEGIYAQRVLGFKGRGESVLYLVLVSLHYRQDRLRDGIALVYAHEFKVIVRPLGSGTF